MLSGGQRCGGAQGNQVRAINAVVTPSFAVAGSSACGLPAGFDCADKRRCHLWLTPSLLLTVRTACLLQDGLPGHARSVVPLPLEACAAQLLAEEGETQATRSLYATFHCMLAAREWRCAETGVAGEKSGPPRPAVWSRGQHHRALWNCGHGPGPARSSRRHRSCSASVRSSRTSRALPRTCSTSWHTTPPKKCAQCVSCLALTASLM